MIFRHHCSWGHCHGPRGRRCDSRAPHVQRALGARAVGLNCTCSRPTRPEQGSSADSRTGMSNVLGGRVRAAWCTC
eukprot:15440206-Alexandrium_andersonii.AAC.1